MSSDFNSDNMSNDRHGSTYISVLAKFPEAAEELFAILNDHDNAVRLETASELNLSALSGIVSRVETSPAIKAVLAAEDASARFRQAVGVAIRIKMETLGWTTTGTKGVVINANYFGKAERYVLSS